jgi:propanol-preferring alcohol dehydrogenase
MRANTARGLEMRAMVLEKPGYPLVEKDVPVPAFGPDQVLLKVTACGVCRTDLHLVDGELPHPLLPVIPGHEVVGRVMAKGDRVHHYEIGQRLGVPWLGHTCGRCRFCTTDRENLCDEAKFTGYTLNGGFAEYMAADAAYCFLLPEGYSDAEAAPLLCAGLIGYRALAATGDARIIGIYGFGAAAHIITQVSRWQERRIFAFTKPGDLAGQAFAQSLGAEWAGDSNQAPPEKMDAALIFAPVGPLVTEALSQTDKGGIVICAGIHMSDIPSFRYDILWGERTLHSIANLTRNDGASFLEMAAQARVKTVVETFSLGSANLALARLRDGKVVGAAVLIP